MNVITVFVDHRAFRMFEGAEVAMLVGRLEPDEQEAVQAGNAHFVDLEGHEVGEGGGLHDGQHLRLVWPSRG